jgi:predicted nucleic acid-binding protein
VAEAYFVDSSALVNRYVLETGTAWVRRLTCRSPNRRIYLAGITAVEVTAAVARRRKGKTLTAAKASSILYRFRQHLAGRYTLTDISPALLDDAIRLANAHALRAYDAVQLAAALAIRQERQAAGLPPVTLISADQALNDAATAEGLTVDDPRSHP